MLYFERPFPGRFVVDLLCTNAACDVSTLGACVTEDATAAVAAGGDDTAFILCCCIASIAAVDDAEGADVDNDDVVILAGDIDGKYCEYSSDDWDCPAICGSDVSTCGLVSDGDDANFALSG